MKREELISYSIFCNGEYNSLLKLIKEKRKIETVSLQKAITILDKEYPEQLLRLKNPPLVLFYEGDISLLSERIIGVIGSRMPCEYASLSTERLVKNKSKEYVVISGLAKGIDRIAHENSENTIGVLGCGLDYCYPKENKELINDMKKNQLVISEYPLGVKPLAHHFPFRNRIIAALSEYLYVMQSSEKSGTLTSVNEALELGVNIKVLPYRADDLSGIYNNRLIEEGAQLITNEEIAFYK